MRWAVNFLFVLLSCVFGARAGKLANFGQSHIFQLLSHHLLLTTRVGKSRRKVGGGSLERSLPRSHNWPISPDPRRFGSLCACLCVGRRLHNSRFRRGEVASGRQAGRRNVRRSGGLQRKGSSERQSFLNCSEGDNAISGRGNNSYVHAPFTRHVFHATCTHFFLIVPYR
jgi:hypothetical protein